VEGNGGSNGIDSPPFPAACIHHNILYGRILTGIIWKNVFPAKKADIQQKEHTVRFTGRVFVETA
jgi:hypothetical protein